MIDGLFGLSQDAGNRFADYSWSASESEIIGLFDECSEFLGPIPGTTLLFDCVVEGAAEKGRIRLQRKPDLICAHIPQLLRYCCGHERTWCHRASDYGRFLTECQSLVSSPAAILHIVNCYGLPSELRDLVEPFRHWFQELPVRCAVHRYIVKL